MKKNEQKKELLKELDKKMNHLGFKAKLSSQRLLKKTSKGQDSFHLTFIDHYDDFDVSCDVSIRLDEIEELINRTRNYLSDNQKKNTFTIGVRLANLTGEKGKRWIISSEDDIPHVAQSLYEYYLEYGEPYFEKYHDYEAIYQVVSNEKDFAQTFEPFHDNRAILAVVLGMKLGKRDLPQLIENKIKYLNERVSAHGELERQYLDNFLNFLKIYDVN